MRGVRSSRAWGRRLGRVGLATCLVLAHAGTACRTPVGVQRVDARRVHRALTANVLTTGNPSASSAHVLARRNLESRFRAEPAAALATLHDDVLAVPDPRLLFALAELSFVHAEQGGGRPHYLASAIYAWAFLFPGRGRPAPEPFDPRLRTAADLYNRGLTLALAVDGGDRVDLGARTLPLPFGELRVESLPESLVWRGHQLEDFVPVAELQVRGLRNRYRRTGIGAPLAGRIGAVVAGGPPQAQERWMPRVQRVSCTTLLRLDGVLAAMADGRLDARLELFVADAQSEVTIDGRRVPLEFEPTAAMAFSLTESHLWDLELAGFFGKDVDVPAGRNLVMLAPHRRGRIPVVMVHGTASSPVRWAEMTNEIRSEPRLRTAYEVWLFFYKTGNPILYSARQLRAALQEVVAVLDPEGRDPGLQRMVVMGHSQGGLLTKLMAVNSGDRFWRNASEVPIADLELEPDAERLLEEVFFFEAIPQVKRVIFIATPHGGSYLAGRRVGNLFARVVRMPGNVVRAGADLLEQDPAKLARRNVERLPSSIDNMTPGHPFLVTLRETPLAAGVTGHSIVAIRSEGAGSDGVVRYESAHIEGVASEKVVISGHSVQDHPDAVAEVRRILLEHLQAR